MQDHAAHGHPAVLLGHEELRSVEGAAFALDPAPLQPFGGFADGIAVENGYVRLPDAPGIGFEQKNNLYAVMKSLAA